MTKSETSVGLTKEHIKVTLREYLIFISSNSKAIVVVRKRKVEINFQEEFDHQSGSFMIKNKNKSLVGIWHSHIISITQVSLFISD
jgi:hypothetical protein